MLRFLHFLFLISFLVFENGNAQLPNCIWAGAVGGPENDYGYAISTDPFGNVYTTGEFQGTADFDPGLSIFNLKSSSFKS